MEQIIVRRGRFLTYELLRRTFGDDPAVQVIWDRRRGTDGVSANGESAERRGQPPSEWDRLDYMFASGKRPNEPPTQS